MKAKMCSSYEDFFEAGPCAVWKTTNVTDPENPYDSWHTIPPCGHHGLLTNEQNPAEDGKFHVVTENPDGTVTVEGSIFCHGLPDRQPCWHGYLRDGEWVL